VLAIGSYKCKGRLTETDAPLIQPIVYRAPPHSLHPERGAIFEPVGAAGWHPWRPAPARSSPRIMRAGALQIATLCRTDILRCWRGGARPR